MKYQVTILARLDKSLSKIPTKTARTIRDKIRSLADEPRPIGVNKLEGEANTYRLRVGDYRIIYEIYDKEVRVLVINIGHRRDIYK